MLARSSGGNLADPSLERLIPAAKVSLEGNPLPAALAAALTRVSVDLDVDLFGQCTLQFIDPKLKLINGTDFTSGAQIKVELGFGAGKAAVFSGDVVALEPLFQRDLPPLLRVVCQESLHRLALSAMTRSFNDVDDKQIVTQIAQEHGLSGDGPAGTKQHILQGNITDASFLRRIAQASGNHLRIEGKKLVVGPPPSGGQVAVGPGGGVRKIKVRIQSNNQVESIAVHGYDPKTKREVVGTARGEGEIGAGTRSAKGRTLAFAGQEMQPADVASAEAMAKGRMRKLAEGHVVATVEMLGNPLLTPGAQVKFEKLGAQLDGTYRVERATHEFNKHGYWVVFRAVRIAKAKPPRPPAPPARPPAPQPQPVAPQPTPAQPTPVPGQQVEVKVLDPMGNPKPHFFFRLVQQGQPEQAGMTDADGFIRLTLPAAGQWRLFLPDVDGGQPQGTH